MTRTRSSSANANGPGALGSAGGGVTPKAWRAAASGAIAQGLSRGVRQQTKTQRPPAAQRFSHVAEGRVGATRRTSCRSAKRAGRCLPGRCGFGGIALPERQVRQPLPAPRARATSSIGFEMSTPRTATRLAHPARASSIDVSPQPPTDVDDPLPALQRRAVSSAASRRAGPTMPSISRCISTQRWPSTPFHSAICSAF